MDRPARQQGSGRAASIFENKKFLVLIGPHQPDAFLIVKTLRHLGHAMSKSRGSLCKATSSLLQGVGDSQDDNVKITSRKTQPVCLHVNPSLVFALT